MGRPQRCIRAILVPQVAPNVAYAAFSFRGLLHSPLTQRRPTRPAQPGGLEAAPEEEPSEEDLASVLLAVGEAFDSNRRAA